MLGERYKQVAVIVKGAGLNVNEALKRYPRSKGYLYRNEADRVLIFKLVAVR